MTVFWSLAVAMSLLALLFVVTPLLRKQASTSVDQDALNAEIARTRLAELDLDLQNGRIEQAQYDAARGDLERELLTDLAGNDPDPRPVRSGRWGALLVAIAIPLGATLLYKAIGSEPIIGLLEQPPAAPQAHSPAGQPSVEEMVTRLATRLASEPDNLKGWTILARTYYVMNRYDLAVPAYRNALRLGGGTDAGLLADFSDTLVAVSNGRFTDEAGELLEQALQLEPNNIKALWLAGHWKYGSGDSAQAIRYWEQAAQQMTPDSEDWQIITGQIQQLRKEAGLPESPAVSTIARANDTAAASPGPAALSVTVALDPALRDRASPDDTVFIFARAVNGPRMPLAIVRKQVRELPATVTLDDSMAMAPTMVLSGFEEVTIGARVSRSGNAMPQSGDLQGEVTPVRPADTERIEVLINRITP
ncbi:MAG: c-type cytochrome biogenesis protein CcmI [Gammaproteobacteria bacterium]